MQKKQTEQITKNFRQYLKNLNDAKKTPTSKEFPFDLISKKIAFLDMFCKIVDKHHQDLEDSYKKASKIRNFKPSTTLVDYFVLDIAMFYECAKRKFKLNESELPFTYKKVKRFRNHVMAHFDKDIKSNAQLVKEYIIINEADGNGYKRIYKDYISFRNLIFNKLN